MTAPVVIWSRIRRPPSWRSPRVCRPASTAWTFRCRQPIPLAHCRSARPSSTCAGSCCPASDRVTMLAQSALDYSWMDHVDASEGVFITAEGLLMYLQPGEAMGLIAACAKRFPGGQMMFDLPPSWAAALTRRGTRASRRYRDPPDAVQSEPLGRRRSGEHRPGCPSGTPCADFVRPRRRGKARADRSTVLPAAASAAGLDRAGVRLDRNPIRGDGSRAASSVRTARGREPQVRVGDLRRHGAAWHRRDSSSTPTTARRHPGAVARRPPAAHSWR